jgi:hypothetical protein
MGEGAGKVIGVGSQPYVLFFSGSFTEGSHVCIVLVFQYSSTSMLREFRVGNEDLNL